MSRFNTRGQRAQTRSPITSNPAPGRTTFEGAQGFKRDTKAELFVLAAGSFFGEGSFYESSNDRTQRFLALVKHTTLEDAAWTARFLAWLRGPGNIRTAAVVGAVEYARTLQALVRDEVDALPLHESHTARAVVRSVLQRADEPGEMLAYCTSTYGRSVPIAIKRGIADAIVGHGTGRDPLYSEYSLLKYDTASHGWRFGDVIDFVHPTGEHPNVKGTALGTLFQYALDRRHGRELWAYNTNPDLQMIAENRRLRGWAEETPSILFDADLAEAGFTWEDALSLAGSKVDKARLWQAMIPNMGYMARIRNLRNFDEAGVSDSVALHLAAQLAEPERVERSRQLPFRFYTAYQAAPSDRFKHSLAKALDHSVSNIPELPGRTLVLIDTSGSMSWSTLSGKSSVRLVDAAALFGIALAKRSADVDVFGFADSVFKYELTRGASVLREVEAFARNIGKVGSGTRIAESVKRTFGKHDRVVVFTDMQTMGPGSRYSNAYGIGDVSSSVPPSVPLYAWNLAGYESSMMETGKSNRHEFGGFSDSAFKIMQTLEAGRDGEWPF